MTLRSLLIVLLCLTLAALAARRLRRLALPPPHPASNAPRARGESALHLLLYLLIAVPLGLALFLETNALLLAFMAACVLAHMAVSLWDTSYAQPRRHISPLEQQIHSYLEMLPVFALALAIVLHWEAVRDPAWAISARQQPLPAGMDLGRAAGAGRRAVAHRRGAAALPAGRAARRA